MATGIEIYNSSGILQVDNSTFNISLLSSGSLQFPTGGGGGNAPTANIVVNGATAPVLCLRSDDSAGPVAVSQATIVAGGTATYTVAFPVGAIGTLYWYVFDVPSPSSENFGLQLFDASGAKVFDSARRPMVIAAVADIPDLRAATKFITLSAPAGRYAACLSAPRVALQQDSANTLGLFREGVVTLQNGAGFTTEMLRVQSAVSAGQGIRYINPIGGKLLMIDVSGY